MKSLLALVGHTGLALLGVLVGVGGAVLGWFRHQQAKTAEAKAAASTAQAQAELTMAEQQTSAAQADAQAAAAAQQHTATAIKANQQVAALTDGYLKKGLQAWTRD